jgi:hypothetical protein
MVNFLIMAVQQNVTLFHCFQWSFQWSSGHLHDIRNGSWVSQNKVADFLTKQQLKSIPKTLFQSIVTGKRKSGPGLFHTVALAEQITKS